MFRFHRKPMNPETRRMRRSFADTLKAYGLGVLVGYLLDRYVVTQTIDAIVDRSVNRGILAGIDNYNQKLAEILQEHERRTNAETGKENGRTEIYS